MNKILIKNITILTMDEENPVIDRGEIAIQGQLIAAVGPAGSTAGEFQPDKTIDGLNKVAMPGFVNCHTHAAMTLLRSYADDLPLMEWLENKIWPLEAKLERDDIYWGTMLCCLEMIRSGTTTFADMYFHMNTVARAVEECGIRASLARGLIGTSPNSEEAIGYSSRFAERWHGAADGRITVMLGPHAPYTCTPDYIQRVMKEASDLGVGIHIHLAETNTEIEIIREQYNTTPIQLMDRIGLFELPVLAAHCVHLNDDDIGILSQKRVGIAHNPQSNMKLASGIAPVSKLLDAGALVGLGTDGAASNNNLDMMEEMRTASLLQKVGAMDPMALPAAQALRMATAGGAGALGLDKEIGQLKPGYKADIIILDGQKPHFYPKHDIMAHIVYAAQSADVDTVIIDGKPVMEGRKILTMDEEMVLTEVQKRAERLISA